MTIGGWITFILSAGSFAMLFVFCMYKVLTSKGGDSENSK